MLGLEISYLDNNVTYYLPSHVVSSHNCDVLKADSGATKTYIKEKHKHNLTEYKKLLNGPKATLPDKTTIEAKGQGTLKYISHYQYQHWFIQS